MPYENDLGQPIGAPLPDWTPPPRPARQMMEGRYCRLEPLSADHAEDLFAAHSTDTEGRMWTYLPEGPFETLETFRPFVETLVASEDPLHYAIVVDGRAVGQGAAEDRHERGEYQHARDLADVVARSEQPDHHDDEKGSSPRAAQRRRRRHQPSRSLIHGIEREREQRHGNNAPVSQQVRQAGQMGVLAVA